MTVALVVARVIPYRLLIPNIIAQLAGATLASYFDWFKNRFSWIQINPDAVGIKIFNLFHQFEAFLLRGYPVGMIPLTDESDLNAVFWAEFFFSFMMTFVAVMAILDPQYK